MEQKESIGMRISRIAREKNIATIKIGVDGFVSISSINRIINGRCKNPSLKVLKGIAQGLHITLEELIKDTANIEIKDKK